EGAGAEGEASVALAPEAQAQLEAEIEELTSLISMANAIGLDTKTRALLTALETGFREMERMGAARMALIFTESRKTQEYLRDYLVAQGYKGRIVTFNGTNTDPLSREILRAWT